MEFIHCTHARLPHPHVDACLLVRIACALLFQSHRSLAKGFFVFIGEAVYRQRFTINTLCCWMAYPQKYSLTNFLHNTLHAVRLGASCQHTPARPRFDPTPPAQPPLYVRYGAVCRTGAQGLSRTGRLCTPAGAHMALVTKSARCNTASTQTTHSAAKQPCLSDRSVQQASPPLGAQATSSAPGPGPGAPLDICRSRPASPAAAAAGRAAAPVKMCVQPL